jgi:hypothetical protein
MQAPIDPNDTTAKHFIYYFAWFWSVTSVVYFFCVTFFPLPEGGRDFANIILGLLVGYSSSHNHFVLLWLKQVKQRQD